MFPVHQVALVVTVSIRWCERLTSGGNKMVGNLELNQPEAEALTSVPPGGHEHVGTRSNKINFDLI